MSATGLERLRERFPRVAVVHDWLTIPGGSEQVVLELLELFPQAELFTSVYDPSPWPAQIKQRAVHSSFLDRIPGAARHYPKLLPLMNAAFRSFDLSRFDLVLSSSHACAKNVRTQPHTLHVCYCHTPMRYAWEEGFLDGEQVGRATRLLLPPLLARLRRQDLAGAGGPDVFVANSRHVAQRIQRYYRRSAEVVNPPVDVERFLGLQRVPGDYYLAYGRVVPYKRVDLAVAACARLRRPLKVAGDGRALDALRAQAGAGVEQAGAGVEQAGAGVEQAGAGVEFLGKVSDSERDRLLSGARALLFAGEEDFGIVPVEAQAAGVPVIAYATGGAAETVLDGRTGVLFAEQSASALVAAIERFERLELDSAHAREHAARFGRERFRAQMSDVIERAAARAGTSRAQGVSS
ncbi:MAG TPA: glycosyltransferase [Solirubrobacteraceae bacterium]|jgi:glycosyltransferase involved in cell wall biosynthesis|nr:glycosyltransferase [Solirubrobacteraceae bacterium]